MAKKKSGPGAQKGRTKLKSNRFVLDELYIDRGVCNRLDNQGQLTFPGSRSLSKTWALADGGSGSVEKRERLNREIKSLNGWITSVSEM